MPTLESIAITTPPTKTAYTVGETFDLSGMVVTATYSDGTTATVTGYDYKETPLTASDTSIGIGYFENGVYAETAVTITVTEPQPTANQIRIQIAKRNGDTLGFSGHAVKRLEYVLSTSFDGDSVQTDEFSAVIRQTSPGWLSNWSRVNRTCAVILNLAYRTEKYYFKSIRRVGKHDFELTAQSPLGRLTDDFPGAVYVDTPLPLRDVLTAIIGDSMPPSAYAVNPLLSKVRVYGWIPYQERRTTLHQLALAYGFLIRRDANHNLYFTVPDTDNPYTIPDNAIFTGGSVDYSVGRTYYRADITAYDYLQRETEAQILFDNTDGAPADNLIVRFDSPMFALSAEGLTILNSGVNYARVSGYGRLTGKPYTRIASVISVDGDANADPQHVLSVSDIPMITSLNAVSVGERLLNYHNAPAVVNADIVRTNQRSGDYVSFNDPFGDPQTGYITALSGSVTSIDRASAAIVCGYVPIWGSAYDAVEVLTETTPNNTWTVPGYLDGKRIRVVLIGGGTGGASGQHGTDANGKGGIGGLSGSGGKIRDEKFIVHAGDTFTYQCGTGGAGGVPSDDTGDNLDESTRVYESNGVYHLKAHGEGTFHPITLKAAQDNGLTPCPDCFQASDRYYVNNAGSHGTASTFGKYSSENGSRSNTGFYDVLETTMYAAPGAYNGVDGGAATTGTENEDRTNPDWNAVVRYPVSLPWDSAQSWTSGSPGIGGHYTREGGDGTTWDWAYGGLGGGAAVGSDGDSGGNVSNAYSGGRGGNGADASTVFPLIRYGGGGNGGHGGGEGGKGGKGHSEATYAGGAASTNDGASGSGGAGSAGQDGADGCILIYYKSPDT